MTSHDMRVHLLHTRRNYMCAKPKNRNNRMIWQMPIHVIECDVLG